MIQKIILAVALLVGSQSALAQTEKYQEGVHYVKLNQATADTGSGTIEVIEAFSYACSHCNTFEPYMQSWLSNKAENVNLHRIPVGFGRRAWELLARGYIAAEMMGVADQSHVAMMDAIWNKRQQFRSVENLAEFYSGFGVDRDAYIAHFKSFAADSQMRRSQRDVQLYGVNGTPTMIVNRKYRVSISNAITDFNMMLDVVNFLVAKETVVAAAESEVVEGEG